LYAPLLFSPKTWTKMQSRWHKKTLPTLKTEKEKPEKEGV
jgi:hypothetical protein